MFAVREGRQDVVEVLLDHGANPNDTLSDGTTALILAIANKRYELAAFCHPQDAPHKVPARFVLCEDLPKLAMGKIDRQALRHAAAKDPSA